MSTKKTKNLPTSTIRKELLRIGKGIEKQMATKSQPSVDPRPVATLQMMRTQGLVGW